MKCCLTRRKVIALCRNDKTVNINLPVKTRPVNRDPLSNLAEAVAKQCLLINDKVVEHANRTQSSHSSVKVL